MSDLKELQQALSSGREQFLALVGELRPQLHRYCARMVGSLIEGEDIVQDTLAKAYYQISMLDGPVQLRPWLFRIAHNTALDFLRRYETRKVSLLEEPEEVSAPEEEEQSERQDTLRLALRGFLMLPPAQRACVILKDIMEHSLAEISETLSMSIPAVKAALHRGRVRLRQLPDTLPEGAAAPLPAILQRYMTHFNARDWDSVRAMLAEEVSLDVVSAAQRFGKDGVGAYFHRYEQLSSWALRPILLEGQWMFLIQIPGRPELLVRVEHSEEKIVRIRDFHHIEYLLASAP